MPFPTTSRPSGGGWNPSPPAYGPGARRDHHAARRGRRPSGRRTAGSGSEHRHQRVVRPRQPAQRQGRGRVHLHRGRRRIVQWTRNDGAWQQWQFVDAGGGYYRLQARHSGKFVELEPNTADGADPVMARPQRHQPAVPVAGLGRRLRAVDQPAQRQGAGVWEWSTADGGMISQFPDLDGFNQQWQMVAPALAATGTGCGSGTGNAEAVLNGSTWTARNGNTTVYTGADMLAADAGRREQPVRRPHVQATRGRPRLGHR